MIAPLALRCPLSERELQVLQLVATGHQTKAIAFELGLGVTTIKTHLTHIFQRLNAVDRAHAVGIAMSAEWIA